MMALIVLSLYVALRMLCPMQDKSLVYLNPGRSVIYFVDAQFVIPNVLFRDSLDILRA
jgi:hypothetical protein